MNQNIVQGTQHGTGHAQGKADLLAGQKRAVEFKQNATGGDVAGKRGDIALACREHHGQRKREANRATNLLRCDPLSR